MSDRLYEGLARYHWWRRRLARARPGERLELHKRLAAGDGDGPAAGVAGLDAWLADRIGPLDGAHVLDVGCGFGATLFTFAARGATGVGITASPYQVRRAREQARALGLGDRVRFVRQRFDAPIDGRFDAAVAVESLIHATDVDAVLANVAGALRPGGRFVALEDCSANVLPDDADTSLLCERWVLDRLQHTDEVRESLDRHGFRVRDTIDLTAQVAPRPAAVLDASERRLRRTRRWLPVGRDVVDAFLGGVALERLYARGAMRYLAWITEVDG